MLYRFALLIISKFQFCPVFNKILNAALHVIIWRFRYNDLFDELQSVEREFERSMINVLVVRVPENLLHE